MKIITEQLRKKVISMNHKRKLFTMLFDHTDLMALFGGMVVSAVGVVILAIAAGFWYL